MRIITNLDKKIEHFSCIISYKTCSSYTVKPCEDCVIPGGLMGVGVFKCCEFTTKRAIYVLIVTLDSTQKYL